MGKSGAEALHQGNTRVEKGQKRVVSGAYARGADKQRLRMSRLR